MVLDSIRKRSRLKTVAVMSLSALIVLWLLSPVAWVVITSFTAEDDLYYRPPAILPNGPYFPNYQFLWIQLTRGAEIEAGNVTALYEVTGTLPGALAEARGMPGSVMNSLIVASSTTALCLAAGMTAAYTFARVPIRGSTKLLFYVFLSRLLPPIAILIPVYVVFGMLGLLDTLAAIIFVHTSFAMPFFVWILYVHFKSVPQSVEDSARVDGCSRFKILTKMMIPIAKPGLIAASVFAFMTSYNEFLFATVLSQTAASRTASATISALAYAIGRYSTPIIMSGATFALIFPIAIVLIFRKTILDGLISIFRR